MRNSQSENGCTHENMNTSGKGVNFTHVLPSLPPSFFSLPQAKPQVQHQERNEKRDGKPTQSIICKEHILNNPPLGK